MPVRGEFGSGFKDVERAEIVEREDRARVRLGLRHLPDGRVRHLAAHEGDVLHARHPHVGDEHAVAEQMAGVLLAQQARADPPLRGRMTRHVDDLPRYAL